MDQQIEEALNCLRGGRLVAYPTDTVYGLGGDATNDLAIRRIYEVKRRPFNLPLPLLVADIDMLLSVAGHAPRGTLDRLAPLMPGPLTVVLLKAPWVPDLVTAGGPTVAVRIPDHATPRTLSARLGKPLVGTSANRSGAPALVSWRGVERSLGSEIDVIMRGVCPGGVESTILDLTRPSPRILREGAVSAEAIGSLMGEPVEV